MTFLWAYLLLMIGGVAGYTIAAILFIGGDDVHKAKH